MQSYDQWPGSQLFDCDGQCDAIIRRRGFLNATQAVAPLLFYCIH